MSGNAAIVAQLLVSMGFGAVVVAIVNWLAQRKKTGADTAVVLSGEARAWAAAAMERVERAEQRVELANQRADETMRVAADCRNRVRILEDYVEELHDVLEREGLTPPPMPH